MSHPNARLTVQGRLFLATRVEAGWTVSRAARAASVSRQTAGTLVRRFRELGDSGLADASVCPAGFSRACG